MTEDDRTLLLQMPIYQKIALSSIILISMVWGSLMKALIYYAISKEKFADRPINVLIVVDMVIIIIIGDYEVNYPPYLCWTEVCPP